MSTGTTNVSQACFLGQAWAPTKCDDWDLSQVPWWLYFTEGVMLWSFCLRLLVRFITLTVRPGARSSRSIYLLMGPQLPVGLLIWQELWHAINGSSRSTIIHMSLQMGWLHMLLFVRSRRLQNVCGRLMATQTQVSQPGWSGLGASGTTNSGQDSSQGCANGLVGSAR